MSDPTTLTEALRAWPQPYPADQPQTLAAIVDADPATVTHPLAWWLRRQAINVANRRDGHFINSPADVKDLISKGYVLHPWDNKWRSYALTDTRQPVLVTDDNGKKHYLVVTTPILPKPEELDTTYRWLVLYGGDTSILTKPGVAAGLGKLCRRRTVADICFYTRETDTVFSSIRAAVTNRNGIDEPVAAEVADAFTAIGAAITSSALPASPPANTHHRKDAR